MIGKKVLSFLFCICLLVGSTFAQKSPKRGMAYGYHTPQDFDVVKTGVSWWYNWTNIPDAGIASYYQSQGVEYVPMVWNNAYTAADVIAAIPNGAKYLLAFNEPNFTVEANMTPAQAVAAWPKVEQVAAAKGLEIVSAVPAYCGGGVCIPGYEDPTAWHNEFFALCPTCKVDYIAFHNYEPTVGGLTALTNNLKIYGRPIWVTEFAYWDPAASPAAKITYLQNAVSAFENDPDIYRYAWFSGRVSSNTTVNILDNLTNGLLTPLGNAYIGAAYGPKGNIPGTIQMENVYRRRGTNLQACTDAGGGQNVGWTDPGTWNEFIVNVANTGSYTFTFRVASNVNTGSFNIKLNDQVVKSNVTVASTGGWQTWTNLVVNNVVLTAGEHLLRLEFTGTGTNINYFQTVFNSNVPATADFSGAPLAVCVGNNVTFTDLTYNKTGGETYAWNFGAGATPATATGLGPHTVSYSVGGQKTVSLAVTNAYGTNTNTKTSYISVSDVPTTCLFSDDYNNSTVNWINPIPGAFSHAEAGTAWTISNGGYGEWEFFRYTLNNGASGIPINFQCAANKPVLKIRAKASGNVLLNVALMDGTNGRSVDNYNNTRLELTTTYQTFTIDFAGRFRNYNSGNPGLLDSANINRIEFGVNPGYVSYPIVGANGTYNSAFNGTIDIDWIGIGDNTCSLTLPIDLVSFTATKETDNSVLLEWSTASETNSDFYEILRSTDGTNFTPIDTVDAAGNSSTLLNYEYTDAGLAYGTYYYKLNEVDINESSYQSPIRAVTLNNSSTTEVYPSVIESGDPLKVLHDKNIKTQVLLVDVTGKVYREFRNLESMDSIQTDGLPTGIYMVKIVSTEKVLTKKIMVY